ncbi:MAG: nickel-responsive transcriptional regulator NikR [Spirochaetales bacterium]|nr:nickel-responsive transcriptional regulator NikR [Spirochaetales bacterium]
MEKDLAQRISLSLPADVVEGLEKWMEQRESHNRSMAVTSILREELAGLSGCIHEVVAGSITLFYDETRPGLQARVAGLLRCHVKEVVTSLSVLLESSMRMEILVVQGPRGTLEKIVAQLLSLKGVRTGRLTLSRTVLPPLHGRPAYKMEASYESVHA